MARRNANPYEPPRHDDEPPQSDRDGRPFELATRGQRFLGALIDAVFNFVLVYAIRAAAASMTDGAVPAFMDLYGPGGLQKGGLSAFAASLVPLAIMGVLIAQRGQSVGKIVMLMRIVTSDGRRAGLYNGFVLRTLPFTAIALIPSLLIALGSRLDTVQPLTFLTSLVSLADALAIFGEERRCLHDRIAGTFVAKAGTERPARAEGETRRKKKKQQRKAAPPGEGEAG